MKSQEVAILILFVPALVSLIWGIVSGTGERLKLKPPTNPIGETDERPHARTDERT